MRSREPPQTDRRAVTTKDPGDAALLDTIDRMPDDAPALATVAVRAGALGEASAGALADYLRALPQLPKAGAVIAERWRIERMLGEGGFGAVFEGRDQQLGRKVAIKVMRGEARAPTDADELRAAITRIEERRRRFHDEARALARAESPNVVTVYDVGEHASEGGTTAWPFLVLELVDGTPLDRVVKDRPTPEAALHIFEQLVHGVMTLHARRLVHRDLKPANALLTHDGRVKIIDFGLAIAASDWTEVRGPKAPEGWIEGTPLYLSPEVTRGGEPDVHSDLWALGVMAYELVSGRSPWGEHLTLAELERRIAHDEPAPIAPRSAGDMPWIAHLTPIIFKMLAKRQADRYQSAADIAAALADLRAQAPRATPSGREGQAETEQPFRYLLAFEEKDAAWFFGREDVVARLVLALEQRGRLVVAGPSGAGKTSVIQAGLIPELKVLRPLEVLRMMPGRDPVARLAGLMTAAGLDATADDVRRQPGLVGERLRAHARATKKRVLVLIDALEELVTQEVSPAEVDVFGQAIDGLRDDTGRAVLLVMAVRDEYLGRLPRLSHAAEGGRSTERPAVGLEPALRDAEFLGPPPRAAMIQALTRPVRRLGVSWQEGFPEEMVDAVQGQASPLPVLQLAASWVWEKRAQAGDGATVLERRLLAADGEALRIGDVLGQYADHKLRAASWSAGDRVLVKRLLPVLVSAEGTPLVVPIEDMLARVPAASRARAQALLRDLTDFRLLTSLRDESAREALTPVHTTLIGGWSLMREALEGSAELEAFLRRFERDARDWEASARDPAKLWPEAALRDFMRWASHLGDVTLSPAQRAFREGVSAQAKKARRVRGGLVALLVALALGGAWAGFTFSRQADQAEVLRADAEAQRAAAEAQRAIAETQTRAANDHRREADELIDYMLGELRSRLAEIQQVRVLRGVAEKASEYLDRRAAGHASTLEDAGDAARRATVLRNLAEVFTEEGDSAASEKALRESLAILERLARERPDDTLVARSLGLTRMSLARALQMRGDPGGALESFKAALATFDALARASPEDLTAQRDLAVIELKVGDLLLELDHPDTALDAFKAALAITERLGREIAEPIWQRDLSVLHSRISAVYFRKEDFAAARAEREKSLAIARRLATADPDSPRAQRDVALAHSELGDVMSALGDHAGARRAFEAALEVDRRFAAADPFSAMAQRDLALSLNKVGDMALRTGDRTRAAALFDEAYAISRRLAEADPDNVVWLRDVANAWSRIGRVRLQGGDIDGGLTAKDKSIALFEHIAGAVGTEQTRLEVVRGLGLYAYEAALAGAVARARELVARAREMLKPILAKPDPSPVAQELEAWLAQMPLGAP